MRCFITGAAGHIGSHLARKALSNGDQVAVLVRPKEECWRLGDILDEINVVLGDMDDVRSFADQIVDFRPEAAFHLAWNGVTADSRNGEDQILANVTGSLELWRALNASGCGCWVGLGSQAEYGIVQGVITEDLPARPVTAYGAAKLAVNLLTEQLCRSAGMRFVWFRLLSTYGPMDRETRLIPTVINQLLAGRRPALTSGSQLWDYLYVEDACDAIYQAAHAPGFAGVYNLASGESLPLRSIVEQVRDLIDATAPLGFGELAHGAGEPLSLQADVSRLRDTLRWKPRVRLREGLSRTVKWYAESARAGKRADERL